MPAAEATTITTTEPLLRLLAWLSPAFPTGAFAYSHGLEWAVEAGDIGDEASLADWLDALLRHGSLWSDAVLLRHALAGADVTALALALQPAAERRAETLGIGTAFARAAAVWGVPETALPYPLALAAACRAHAVPADAVLPAFLHAGCAALVNAAVRLVPLGQTAGLRVLAGLEPAIVATAQAAGQASLDELGGACFRSDIAAMRHETQYTRLFRS